MTNLETAEWLVGKLGESRAPGTFGQFVYDPRQRKLVYGNMKVVSYNDITDELPNNEMPISQAVQAIKFLLDKADGFAHNEYVKVQRLGGTVRLYVMGMSLEGKETFSS